MSAIKNDIDFWLRLLSSLKPGMQKTFKFFTVKKGQSVYRHGQPVAGVYFIKYGKAKVMLHAADDRQRIIHIGTDNSFLAYKEVILGISQYQNTVMALEDTVLFLIPPKVFIDLMHRHPDEAWAFCQRLCADLLEVENNMVGFNSKNVGNSVAYTLLWLGKYFKNGTLPLSRGQFAMAVGTAPETVIRVLSEFKRKKLVSVTKGKIKILNRRNLQKELKN